MGWEEAGLGFGIKMEQLEPRQSGEGRARSEESMMQAQLEQRKRQGKPGCELWER